ncbi:MAG: S-layer homology domain-containing protein [Oscillospiraceae bacterium]|nr:S-layer homology domain-containing protein [Oscillospiraceae bacterium]
MKRRIISLFLALTMVISLAPAVFAADKSFTDVTEADWFYAPVQWAVENGITSGLSDTAFGPNVICTRGQVVTFLWAAANKPEPKLTNNPFSDVKDTDWFYKSVLWAVENSITSGLTPDSFGPNEPCTRGQVVTFLWAAANKPEPNLTANPFADVSEADWFYTPVLWAAENKITGGLTPNTFGAYAPCTRGQIVTFLYAAENPSDDPIEIPPAKPNINEKEIYTSYLVNGGYDALTGRNTKYNINKAETVTIFADFDGNGIKDLSISFTNRAWFSKGYLHEYQGLYTIDPSTKEVVQIASYLFDSGTDFDQDLRFMYNPNTEEHLFVLYTKQWLKHRPNGSTTYTEMRLDGQTLVPGNSYRQETYLYPNVDPIYEEAIEALLKGPHRIDYGTLDAFFVNGVQVTAEEHRPAYDYRVPTDPAYEKYNGTYYEPIK